MMKQLFKLLILLVALPLCLFSEDRTNLMPTIENQCFENPPAYSISGYVTKEDGTPLVGVIIDIDGVNYYTDENGFYSTPLFDVAVGGFSPFIFDSWQNGVDALDLEVYRDNMDTLNLSPYKMIAADLNLGESWGSTFNLVLLSKIVLGTYVDETSPWRFIKADYVFPEPLNPWAESWPEAVNITGIPENNLEINWIGYKMGDLDCSADPNVGNGLITGRVFIDENDDCILNVNEERREHWIVTLDDGTNLAYTTTNSNGEYSFLALAGDYQITLNPPYNLWEPCLPVYDISIQIGETETLDIGAKIIEYCPILEIEIATYGLVRCFEGTYVVNYQNTGTETAENVSIEIVFDDFFTVTESELAWNNVEGNTYFFDIGTVEAGSFVSFSMTVDLSCDAVLGQTHCSSAYIHPDEFCDSSPDEWDGASIELQAWCDGDSLYFEITNIGENMQSPVELYIVEDDLVMLTNPVQLSSGETQTIIIPAAGATYRLIVQQTSGHPGRSMPSIAFEGCGENEDGVFSLGFVTLFPEDDEDAFVSIHCIENVGSFDPNDKQVLPKGIYEEHFIEANRELEYFIRFQNTGTASALNIVIKDSISSYLDPTSIHLGPSSHPYKFSLTGNGLAEFTFENIMLPDSNTNEAASHGFVQFSIKQKNDLPIGTAITNKAEIYFDFNEPIVTNTTLNTIGEHFLIPLNTTKPSPPTKVAVSIYPLPSNDYFIVDIEAPSMPEKEGFIQLFDLNGKKVLEQKISSNKVSVDCKSVPKGIYFVKILLGGDTNFCKKLIIM